MGNEFNTNDDFEPSLASVSQKKVRSKEASAQTEGQLTIDVFQTEDDVVIQSTIAGVNREDVDISVTKDMVTVKGRRAPEVNDKPVKYDYQELYWGPFSRSVILPVDVDADQAKAAIKNGILTIKLPKLIKSSVKKIRILD